MVSLEEKLSPHGMDNSKFYRLGGERIHLAFPRDEAPQYYLLVENHNHGYHGHVLKLVGDEYVRTNQMITKVGDNYFMETHGKKRAKVHVSQKKELDDIVADIQEDMLAKLSRFPEDALRKTISSYARKIYPDGEGKNE